MAVIESIAANIAIDDGKLRPSAFNIVESRFNIAQNGALPIITRDVVSILVGTDIEAADVLQDWDDDLPQGFKTINLNRMQREILQRQRLFLRNRRIVSGYELLDRQLRATLSGGVPGAHVPPTWLTIGKWTAKTIGGLLSGESPVPSHRSAVRRLVRLLLRALGNRRAIAMGRVFLLGNREIFAQVASALVIFTTTDFEELGLNFSAFVGKYGDELLGFGGLNIVNELIFPISAATRDPLSDSMLRALHCYYRAIDSDTELERSKWVITGNLHLAAYEQRVAQTFVDLGLAVDAARGLKNLLASLPPLDNPRRKLLNRPLDMLVEDGFGRRVVDLAVAAFATRYNLTLAVGLEPEQQVFAPVDPLELVNPELVDFAKTVTKAVSAESAEALQRIWFALDRADGKPGRCRVRDWRNYSARMSYIANLFLVARGEPQSILFDTSVFSDEEISQYLSGRLIGYPGIVLDEAQRQAAEDLIRRHGSRPRTNRTEPDVAA